MGLLQKTRKDGAMERLTVIIKPTSDCNLRCKYCYVGEPIKSLMNIEAARVIMKKIIERLSDSDTAFIWHGGEPMLAGLDFYRQVAEFCREMRKRGYEISNSIQTNGTLITESWADFFKEESFSVSLSIDGPQEVHDIMRIDASNKGSFSDVQRGIEILNRKGVKFGSVAVLSGSTARFTKQIISFMQEEGISFKLNSLDRVGRARYSAEDLSLEKGDYARSQIEIFDRWMETGEENLREAVMRFIKPLLTGSPKECGQLTSCQNSFLGVDFDGSVYPCGRFCGNKHFRYGNIVEDTFMTIWKSPLRDKLTHSKLPGKCESCSYTEICNAGCPCERWLSEIDVEDETTGHFDSECHEHRKIFNHISGVIEQEIDAAKKTEKGGGHEGETTL